MTIASAKVGEKKPTTNVELNILNTVRGDKDKKFEDTPEGRKKLAVKITKFIRAGTACFLQVGTGKDSQHFKIAGYDAETNEWLIQGPRKISAEGTKVLVVPPSSGG